MDGGTARYMEESNMSVTGSVEMLAHNYPEFQAGVDIHQYWLPVVIVIGLIGNTLSIVVICQGHNRIISTYCYLCSLALTDSSMLCIAAFVWMRHNMPSIECRVIVYLFQMFSMTGLYLIFFMTLDKCFAILTPLKAKTRCTPARAKVMSSLTLFGSAVYNLPHLFNIALVENFCVAFPIAQSSSFYLWYTWLSFCINCLVPFTGIVTMNTIIICKLRSRRQRRMMSSPTSLVNMEKMTSMLLVVSFTLLLLTLPQYIRYIYYVLVDYRQDPHQYARYVLWYNITNKLFFTNHAVNFVLYCISGSQFRQDLFTCVVVCFQKGGKQLRPARRSSTFGSQSSTHFKETFM